jgi:hypothetical protein
VNNELGCGRNEQYGTQAKPRTRKLRIGTVAEECCNLYTSSYISEIEMGLHLRGK